MTPQFADPRRFRPRTPAIAAVALDKGVPLAHLDVDDDQRAWAVLLSKRFEAEALLPIQDQALAHLARKVRWARASDDGLTRLAKRVAFAKDGTLEDLPEADLDHRQDVWEAVRRSTLPITDFPAIGPKGTKVGRPRKIELWIPADWPWPLVLNWFFEHAIRKHVVRRRDDDVLTGRAGPPDSLDATSVDEDGNETARLETLDGDLVPAGGWYRQIRSGGKMRHGVLLGGSHYVSPGERQARRLKFKMVKNGVAEQLDSNPKTLPGWITKEIRRDLDESEYGIPYDQPEAIAADPDRAHPDNMKFVDVWKARRRREVNEQVLEQLQRDVAETKALVTEIRDNFPAESPAVVEAERVLREEIEPAEASD